MEYTIFTKKDKGEGKNGKLIGRETKASVYSVKRENIR